MSEEKTTKKTRECLSCEKLFKCKGKPIEIEYCLHYEPREKGVKDDRAY